MDYLDSMDVQVVDLGERSKQVDALAAVAETFHKILYRLKRAGMYPPDQMAFLAPPKFLELHQFDWHGLKVGEIPVGDLGGVAYLLTFRAGDVDLIAPPYDPTKERHLTWHEYLLETTVNYLTGGQKTTSLVVVAPWAQAKFTNVEASSNE